MPPVEEPVLEVAKVDEVCATVGASELASSLLMAVEPQGESSALSLFLRRGNNKVALRHGDFCPRN